MALKVGDLYVAVTASIGEFTKSMAQVAKATEEAAKKVKEAAKGVADVGLLFAAGIGGAVMASAQANRQMAAHIERLKKLLFTLAADIGDLFEPLVGRLVSFVEKLVAGFQRLSPELKGRLAEFATLGAEIGIAALAISKLAGLVEGVAKAFGIVSKIIAAIGAPVLGTIAVVLALVVAVIVLHRAWRQNWGGIQEKTEAAIKHIREWFGEISPVFMAVLEVLKTNWLKTLALMFRGASKFADAIGFKGIAKALSFGDELAEGLTKMSAPEIAAAAYDKAKDVGETIVDGLKDALKAGLEEGKLIIDELGLKKLMDKLKDQFSGGSVRLRATIEEQDKKSAAFEVTQQLVKAAVEFRDAAMTPAFAVTGLLVSQAMKFKETTEADLARRTEAMDSLTGMVLSRVGDIKSIVDTGIQGFAAGGPLGAFIAVMADLATRSEGFKTLVEMLNTAIQQAADMFTPMFAAMQPIIGAVGVLVAQVSGALSPALEALGQAIEPLAPILVLVGMVLGAFAGILTPIIRLLGGVLKPALQALFEAIRFVAQIIGAIVLGIGYAWNGILQAIQWVIGLVRGFLEFIGVDVNGLLASLDAIKAPVGEIEQALTELSTITWAQAEAQAAANVATLQAAKAMNDVAESTTNMPSWWKVAAARFGAADPGGPAAAVPGAGLGPSAGAPAQGAAPVVGTNVEVMNVQVVDPGEFLDVMEEKANKGKKRWSGNPVGGQKFVVP